MIDRLLTWLERRRRFQAALRYNREYTFKLTGPHAHTWQCPQCGRVHHAHSTRNFFGPQFDACCDLPAGGRMERRFAMPWAHCW